MFYFTLAMIAGIVVGGLILVFPSYSRGRELRRQELQLRAQIAGMELFDVALLVSLHGEETAGFFHFFLEKHGYNCFRFHCE